MRKTKKRTTRRPNGDGSIFQLPDGRWRSKLTFPIPGGTGRKEFTARTQAEALAKLNDYKDQLRTKPTQQLSKSETFQSFFSGLLDTIYSDADSKSSKTYWLYVNLAKKWVLPVIGDMTLESIAEGDIDKILRNCENAALKPHSINRVRQFMSTIMNHALKRELVKRNVVVNTRTKKVKESPKTVLNAEKQKQLLTAAKGSSAEGPIIALVKLGLRAGEACGLKPKDIDLEQNLVTVRQQIQRVRRNRNGKLTSELEEVRLKTERSNRIVPLEPVLRQWLLENGAMDRKYCFETDNHTPFETRNVNKAFLVVLKRAGLPHMRLHDLRHTAASNWKMAGADTITIMELLGHSKPDMSHDYMHSNIDRKREVFALVS